MLDEQNQVVTSHSVYPVPFLITTNDYKLKDGKLADIAPTLLSLIGLQIPSEMTGNILITK